MAAMPRSRTRSVVDYPTSDGKPMAETEHHRILMSDLIATLEARYAADPTVHVGGNLMLFYEEGNRRKHLSPDVFVTFGMDKAPRLYYLTWVEGKGPDVVFEITSRTTRSEDLTTKKILYRDVLKVAEYFLFDPFEEYLRPSMQGFRLAHGEYEPIEFEGDRLPSRVLNLWLERDRDTLRLVDAATGARLPTTREVIAEAERARATAEQGQIEADRARAAAEAAADAATQQTRDLMAEIERLRREMDALKRPET